MIKAYFKTENASEQESVSEVENVSEKTSKEDSDTKMFLCVEDLFNGNFIRGLYYKGKLIQYPGGQKILFYEDSKRSKSHTVTQLFHHHFKF